MINIKPVLWSCKLLLEEIFIGFILFFYIIQIPLTDRDHWIFNVIQIPTCIFNLLNWCYLFIRRRDNNIGCDEPIILDDMIFVLDLLLQNYWLQTQVKHLLVQSKFKALLSREVVKFMPIIPGSGLGQSLTLTWYSCGLTKFTWSQPY